MTPQENHPVHKRRAAKANTPGVINHAIGKL
jgi:hypothetical protein